MSAKLDIYYIVDADISCVLIKNSGKYILNNPPMTRNDPIYWATRDRLDSAIELSKERLQALLRVYEREEHLWFKAACFMLERELEYRKQDVWYRRLYRALAKMAKV
jgi:hypothetical protein